jgi:hypothetical protein
MESTQRRCAVEGCERHPQPGWARCDEHVEQWLDRVLLSPTRAATKAEGYELPRYLRPIDELENRLLHGDR